MEVLLIRHGDPDYANDTLTELGHREAKLLALHLAKTPLHAIYVSPLGRAQDTMRYTAEMAGLDFVTLDWLREIQAPRIDGHAAWELPGTYILGRQELPGLDTWAQEPLFGATFFPFYQRIAEGFDAIISSHGYVKSGHLYRVVRSSSERIAFFCHKGTILTLLSYLLHWPLPLLFPHCQIHPTGVTRLLWKETDGQWAVPQLQAFNDLCHLKDGDQLANREV